MSIDPNLRKSPLQSDYRQRDPSSRESALTTYSLRVYFDVTMRIPVLKKELTKNGFQIVSSNFLFLPNNWNRIYTCVLTVESLIFLHRLFTSVTPAVPMTLYASILKSSSPAVPPGLMVMVSELLCLLGPLFGQWLSRGWLEMKVSVEGSASAG